MTGNLKTTNELATPVEPTSVTATAADSTAAAPNNCVEFPNPPSTPAPNSTKKRTRTPAQAEASRKNGKKSQGPTSAQGKARSSQNASGHNFTAVKCCYSNQNYPGIQRIHRNLVTELKPRTPLEHALIDTISLARWQQMSIPREIAALVNFTRDTQIADPNIGPALANALAIEKQHQKSETLNLYHRYLKDAERRQYRAVRELNFLRLNSHTLHELESAAAHEHYEPDPDSASTIPAKSAASQPSPSQNPAEKVDSRNDPEQSPENKPLPDSSTAKIDPVYGENDTPAGQNTANSHLPTRPVDRKDPWLALSQIQQTLLNFPEAYRAVASALVKLEEGPNPVSHV